MHDNAYTSVRDIACSVNAAKIVYMRVKQARQLTNTYGALSMTRVHLYTEVCIGTLTMHGNALQCLQCIRAVYPGTAMH